MQTLSSIDRPDLDSQSELQAAFQLFSQMSGQLEKSYRELEGRVEQLTQELATARSEKLKQLAEKEKLADQLEALHEALPAAVIWMDAKSRIRSANQAANKMFATDIVNQNWQQLLEQKFSFDGHELLADDGSVFSYHQRSLEQQQGQVVILTDVTLSRQLQQSNYRQQRLAELGEITAGIAHQVRTPLASALLSVGHLSHPSVDEALRQKSVDRIKQNLHHLDKFVNDMLLYAKDGEFDNNCINVSLLLHNLEVYVQQKHFHNASFEIQNNQSTDLVVSGSGDALLSVLISLVENASQLATETTAVEVSVKTMLVDGECVISVIDNGPGLSAQQCKQIFKPFYTTKEHGTGLGLAISRSIIRAHHGQLDVFSTPGKGTEMKIQLKQFVAEQFMQSNSNKVTPIPSI